MAAEEAAPCRHRGVPPTEVVDRVIGVINNIVGDEAYLYARGLSSSEYRMALPAAIERLRGSTAASNSDRRDFLTMIFNHLVSFGTITSFTAPVYGKDTVYRLVVPAVGEVAIIQKGCPDGNHSSVAWTVPEWADETYLWWLCPSLAANPGEHVSKGVNRLRNRFFSEKTGAVDGIIFHNDLCGSDLRPCPKVSHALSIGEAMVPPPCIWVMPDREQLGPDYYWDGRRQRLFPSVLLSAFGIDHAVAPFFTGHVGFQGTPRATRTTITSRFGAGRSTSFRS